MTGAFGDMGCFSFYANKIITTGEGGMVTTNDDALAERLRLLRNLAFGTPALPPRGGRLQLPDDGLPGGDGPRAAAARSSRIIEEKRRVARDLRPRCSPTSPGIADSGRARVGAERLLDVRDRASTDEFPLTRDELIARARARRGSSRARSSAR